MEHPAEGRDRLKEAVVQDAAELIVPPSKMPYCDLFVAAVIGQVTTHTRNRPVDHASR